MTIRKAKKIRDNVLRGAKLTSKQEAFLSKPGGIRIPSKNWIFNPIRYRPKNLVEFFNIGNKIV